MQELDGEVSAELKEQRVRGDRLGCAGDHRRPLIVYGQEQSAFPDGYDAIQAAPDGHKVVFANALVRVLEVTVSPSATTIPMHHHRWPSFFLSWDRGGHTTRSLSSPRRNGSGPTKCGGASSSRRREQ